MGLTERVFPAGDLVTTFRDLPTNFSADVKYETATDYLIAMLKAAPRAEAFGL